MSWLTDALDGLEPLGDIIGDIGGGIQTGFNAATEGYRDLAPEWVEDPLEAIATVPAALGQQVAKPALEKYGAAWTKVVGRPLTTVFLINNPHYRRDAAAQAQLEGQDVGLADFFRNAYNASSEVSPGQALGALPFTGQRTTPGTFGYAPWEFARIAQATETPSASLLGFNPTNEAIRKKVFEESIFGRAQSGGADLALMWYTDPLYGLGKASKFYNTTIRGLTPASESSAAIAKVAEREQATLFADGTAERNHLQWYADNDATTIIHDDVVRESTQPEALASALGGARTADEAAVIYLAARGNPYAIKELQNAAASEYHRWEVVNGDFEAVNRALAEAENIRGNPMAWQHWTAQRNYLSAVVEDAKLRSDWLNRMVAPGQRAGIAERGMSRALTSSKRFESWQASRATSKAATVAGQRSGYWAADVMKSGPFAPMFEVWRFIGGDRPSHWIGTKGDAVAGSANELRAAMDDLGLKGNVYNGWMNRWLSAGDEESRLALLSEFDLYGHTVLARKHGLSDEVAAEVAARTTEAKADALTFMREEGFLFDPETNKFIITPQMVSQLDTFTPMTNFKLLDDAFQAKAMADRAVAGSELAQVQMRVAAAKRGVDTGLSMFNQIWKPAVLLRFGYTQRNVGESLLAAFVQTGRLVADPLTGTKNVALNTLDRAKGHSWLGANKRTTRQRAEIMRNAEFARLQRHHLAKVREESVKAQSYDVAYTEITPRSTPFANEDEYYAAIGIETPLERGVVDEAVASATSSVLGTRQRARYGELQAKVDSGTATPEEFTAFQHLYVKAARKVLGQHVRNDRVVPQWIDADGNLHRTAVADIPDEAFYPAPMTGGVEAPPVGISGGAVQPVRVGVVRRYADARKGYAQTEAEAGRRVTDADVARGVPREPLGRTITRTEMDAEIKQEIDRIDLNIRTLDQQIEEQRIILREMATPPRERRGVGTGEREYFGKTLNRAFNGEDKSIRLASSSANHTNEIQRTAVDSDRIRARQMARQVIGSGRWTKIEPGSPEYFDAVTDVANHQFMFDPVAMRIMADEHIDDIVTWVRTTPEGQAWADRLRIGGDRGDALAREWGITEADELIEIHVARLAHAIDGYLPDEALRHKLAAKQQVSVSEVEAGLAGRDLIPVHGEQMVDVLPTNTVGEGIYGAWDAFTKRAFQILGTMPEDRMARWPMYSDQYDNYLANQVARLEHSHFFAGKTEKEVMDYLSEVTLPAAHDHALTQVKRTFYTVSRRTNLASATRYFMPFFQVTQNRLAYYGRQLVRNPDNLTHVFRTYDAIDTGEDIHGNKIVTVRFPGDVAKMLGIESTPELSFNKRSLNLMFQGEPWFSPGFGPVVTVPIGHVVRTKGGVPEGIQPMIDLVLPIGAGDSWVDQVIPTTIRRIFASQEGTEEYVNSYSEIAAWEMFRYKNKLRDDKPTREEIEKRVNGFWMFRILAAAGLPAQPRLRTPLASLVDKYRKMRLPVDEGGYGEQADEMFLSQHPEYYDYILAATKSETHVDPTQLANQRLGKYNELAGDMAGYNPDMIALITNIEGPNAVLDPDAYNWQLDRPVAPGSPIQIREGVDFEERLSNRRKQHGWVAYNQFKTLLDAALVEQGFTDAWGKGDHNASGAEYFKAIRALKLEELAAEFPEWHDEWLQRDLGYYRKNAAGLERMLSDEKYVQDNLDTQPWLGVAAEYIESRQLMTEMLAERKRNGLPGTLEAKANADLLAIWVLKVKQLNAADPHWADVWDRYFEGDNFMPPNPVEYLEA